MDKADFYGLIRLVQLVNLVLSNKSVLNVFINYILYKNIINSYLIFF
jgi:hypothetical protein